MFINLLQTFNELFGQYWFQKKQFSPIFTLGLDHQSIRRPLPLLYNFMVMKYIIWFTLLLLNVQLKAQANATNPCDHPKLQEFDFWIGEWSVFKYGTDTLIGYNSITPVAGGCALQENWRSAGGPSIGTSLNKYAFNIQKWQQMWVDNSGQTLQLSGSYADGKMVMGNEQISRDGQRKILNRITWSKLDHGHVRQLWEQSSDGGTTWTTSFDGEYKKK